MPKDLYYYDLLGVGADASEDQIKKAFRKKALQFHPDRHVDQEDQKNDDMFKEINTAYNILSDPEKRAAYDKYGKEKFYDQAGQTQADMSELICQCLKMLFGSDRFVDFLGDPTTLPQFKKLMRSFQKSKEEDQPAAASSSRLTIENTPGHNTTGAKSKTKTNTNSDEDPIKAEQAAKDEVEEDKIVRQIKSFLELQIDVNMITKNTEDLYKEKWKKIASAFLEEVSGYQLIRDIYIMFGRLANSHAVNVLGFRHNRLLSGAKTMFTDVSEALSIVKDAISLSKEATAVQALSTQKEEIEESLKALKEFAVTPEDLQLVDKLSAAVSENNTQIEKTTKEFTAKAISTVWKMGKMLLVKRLSRAVELFLTEPRDTRTINLRCKYLELAAATLREAVKSSDASKLYSSADVTNEFMEKIS